MTDKVVNGLDKETLLSILKRAASQERMVAEFRTIDRDGQRELHHVADITDHVEALEEEQDRELSTNI